MKLNSRAIVLNPQVPLMLAAISGWMKGSQTWQLACYFSLVLVCFFSNTTFSLTRLPQHVTNLDQCSQVWRDLSLCLLGEEFQTYMQTQRQTNSTRRLSAAKMKIYFPRALVEGGFLASADTTRQKGGDEVPHTQPPVAAAEPLWLAW